MYSCDVCGCSSSGQYMGVLPQFQKHFLGVQYYYRQFHTETHSIFQDNNNSSQETFQTLDVRGRISLAKKLQILFWIPINQNQQNTQNQITRLQGLGDASLVANYIVFNTSDSTCSSWKKSLQWMGGLKMPTGKFNYTTEGSELNPYIQLGTGSWDFLANAIYTLRYQSIGMNTAVMSRITTANANQFRLGSKVTGLWNVFYWGSWDNKTLLPNMGLMYDYAFADQEASGVYLGGGSSVFATAGIDFYLPTWIFSLNYQQPIAQKFISLQHIQNQPRILVNLLHTF
jgi:hypothetical protein